MLTDLMELSTAIVAYEVQAASVIVGYASCYSIEIEGMFLATRNSLH